MEIVTDKPKNKNKKNFIEECFKSQDNKLYKNVHITRYLYTSPQCLYTQHSKCLSYSLLPLAPQPLNMLAEAEAVSKE